MRRLTLWLVSTLSAVVLLFSYHTSTGGSGDAQTAALAPANPGGTSSSSAPSATGSTASGSFTGSSVDTRWGPAQVQITGENSQITDVQAVVYPSDNPRDQEINAYALPLLHDEVIQAQSARVDAISGATVTSDGYLSSLQSAIDAAHLGS